MINRVADFKKRNLQTGGRTQIISPLGDRGFNSRSIELLPVDGITSAARNLARAGQMPPEAMRRNARVPYLFHWQAVRADYMAIKPVTAAKPKPARTGMAASEVAAIIQISCLV
jgi:hypothetical protein